MAEDFERRIRDLEEDVAELEARYTAALSVLTILIFRLDYRTFREVIEILDWPLPPGLPPAAHRKADYFFSEFSAHLWSLRKKEYGDED